MYTQCPQCQTVYSVTIETLRQAGGQVECGQCSLRFNALPRLSETFPTGDTKAEVATPQSASHGADAQAAASATQADLSQPQHDTGEDVPVAESGADSVPEAGHGTDAGEMPLMEQEPPQDEPEVNPEQDDAHADTGSVDVSAEGAPDETHEYDTWLRHLDREWDPTQTGTQDAWSRAAPQVDPPPDAGESGTVPHLAEDADADDGAEHAQDEDKPAEPTEKVQAMGSGGERSGLDTGISYIESWAEDLLAEAEREDVPEPETATDDSEPEPLSKPESSTTGVSAADETAGQPQATIQAGTPVGDETGAEAPGEINGISDPAPADEAPATHADGNANVDADVEAEEARGEDQPEPDADDKWLEETWATDTQSFQPEIWLEPDFVDQNALPEKLEGAGGEDDADDHAATDPAIRTEADRKQKISDEIAGLWPDIDGDAEVEEIVLESPEPEPELLQPTAATGGPISSGDTKDDAGNIIALPDQIPTPTADAATTAAEAAAVAAAGKVQAAAVKVTTGSQAEDKDARLEGDDPASLAARAEERRRQGKVPGAVHRSVGLEA